MKLINRIILHISWVLTLLLAAWASLFYFAMVDEINDEVDDSLEFYSEMLITRSLAGRELPSSSSGSNNSYYLREVTSDYADSHPNVAYSDEEIYIPEMEESEPARVLRTIFEDRDGRLFELTVLTPSFEKDDLLETILWCMVWLYLLLLLTILLVNVLVLHRILRPLYALLRWLDSYTVGRATNRWTTTRVFPSSAGSTRRPSAMRRAPSTSSTARSSSSATPRTRCRRRWPSAATGSRCWSTRPS